MAKKESKLFADILVATSKLGARLFRNNVGLGWQGKSKYVGESVQIEHPRRVKYGLCTGSSDAIGWTPITIKQEHVGQTLAIFTAVETKGTKALATTEQRNFLDQVERAGGIAIVAYCINDATKVIKEAIG